MALFYLAACDDGEVLYGPVGGLRVRGAGSGGAGTSGACPLPPGTDETGATCPSWTTTVWPLLRDSYGCANDGCHGGVNGSANLTFVMAADGSYAAQEAFDVLNAYKRGDRPYVLEGGQSEAYLMCNIWRDSPTQFNPLMPIPSNEIGLIEGDDLLTIANWVACGMPPTGEGVGAGGGGATGVGGGGLGAGGLGGAGGQ